MNRDRKPTRPTISVVVPLFDEADNLPALYRRLTAALEPLVDSFELVLVNDGSRDATAVQLDALAARDRRVVVIHLSRNFGHQAAVSAGLDHARGQAVIVMDGDLQDPPEALGQFIDAWRLGHDVVYAIRTKRKEGLLKRAGYWLFYRLLKAVSNLDIPLDSGDFCLMDRKVVRVLRRMPEQVRFVRGLRTFAGFRQVGLAYERAARAAGNPKYTFAALLRLAVDGLVSFSGYPLRLATVGGLLSALLGTLLGAWVVLDSIFNSATPRGWASTCVLILFMGSVQLLYLGILGAYVQRIFLETKGRPTYIVNRLRNRPRRTRPATGAPVGAALSSPYR